MHILLVEDNTADITLLQELFSKQSSVYLHTASDGAAALDYLYRRNISVDTPSPDVVVLDLSLPRISGYDVLKRIKSDSSINTCCVVLTTSCSPADRELCTSLGAEMFLTKPQSMKGYEELVHLILAVEFSQITHLRRRES